VDGSAPSGERLRVLTFRVDTCGAGYACGLSDAEIARVMNSAKGRYGSCLDYVRNTVESLAQHGIRDARLARLVESVCPSNGKPNAESNAQEG
jgi:cation transport protein ChaC